jgi:hypothetical protein
MEEESKNQKEPFNDEWLTRALRSRSQAEARPGLEGRILARLASEREVKSQRRWRWIPALAVAFGLLLIVLVGRQFLRLKVTPNSAYDNVAHMVVKQESLPTNPLERTSPGETNKSSKANSLKPRVERSQVARAEQPVSVTANTTALPKLAHFPADRSATEQERLLASFLKKQGSARVAQFVAQARPPEDLTIEPLSIAPIDLGNVPNN